METGRVIFCNSRYNSIETSQEAGSSQTFLEDSVRVPRIFALIAVVGSLALALDMAGQAKLRHAKAAPAPPDPTAMKAYGSKTAPITLEVFSDYQCPACRVFYEDTLRLVIENYVNSGKVYLIHRDFPLAVHAHSREAARYANAAARIGKFDKAEEALFAKQAAWDKDGNLEGALSAVLSPAEMSKVRQLMKSGDLDAGIEKDVAEGNAYRVNQTPTTIIIHGDQKFPVSGGISYPVLSQFLDQLLKQ